MPPVDLPMVETATEGDLIITVNSQIELLVRSQFLTMLSPAFRAMLGPEWLREQSLLSISTAKPGRLNLPDDEAEATKLLFLVFHSQNNQLPFLPTPKNFLDLAKAAQKVSGNDKYKTGMMQSVLTIDLVRMYPGHNDRSHPVVHASPQEWHRIRAPCGHIHLG